MKGLLCYQCGGIREMLGSAPLNLEVAVTIVESGIAPAAVISSKADLVFRRISPHLSKGPKALHFTCTGGVTHECWWRCDDRALQSQCGRGDGRSSVYFVPTAASADTKRRNSHRPSKKQVGRLGGGGKTKSG
jgi:hypothetical protein